MGKSVIDIQGNPATEDSIALAHGYGYFAYCCSNNQFFNQFMRELSIWSGATKSYHTTEGYFSGYELDCRDKKFFKSSTFRKICQRCGMELIICEDDCAPLRKFFDSIAKY